MRWWNNQRLRALELVEAFDGIVTNADLAQTILDAAGVSHHPRMQGRSFWPDLKREPAHAPAPGMYNRYWEHEDQFHMAHAHYDYRTERHELICFYNDGLGIPGSGPFTCTGMLTRREVFHLNDKLIGRPSSVRSGSVRRERSACPSSGQTGRGFRHDRGGRSLTCRRRHRARWTRRS
ncbi:sulfatase/phosphatase domain-containing protein [uncultured Microbacterium sp.]|uniref:sulfatase/phosphatase domain-containing protein n=1 Tax=uncultured Microbacterium sp. TaxID=191216 RepID=UPI0034587976